MFGPLLLSRTSTRLFCLALIVAGVACDENTNVTSETAAITSDTSVIATTLDENGNAFVEVDGERVYPEADDRVTAGAIAVAPEVSALPDNYAELQAAELASFKAAQLDPLPFLQKLASYSTGSTSVAVVRRDGTEALVAGTDLVSVEFQVLEVIAGGDLPNPVHLKKRPTDGHELCGEFSPAPGGTYAVFVQTADGLTYEIIQPTDYYNGWFWALNDGNFRIDRGPVVSREQLATLVLSDALSEGE